MTAHALVAGTLFRAPERKISKGGKHYVSATIKCRDGDAAQFWRVTIFSESASEEMMRLAAGDAVSAQGQMSAEVYRPENGEPRLSLSLVADTILPLRRTKQPREKRAADTPAKSAAFTARSSSSRSIAGHRSPSAPHGWHATDAQLNDDIPF
jgi:single-stranded DNA-binding protein